MRNIDEIIAEMRKSTEASLREAYEAGRSHTAAALKSRMVTFFETLFAEVEAPATDADATEPPPESPEGHHGEHGDGGRHHEG